MMREPQAFDIYGLPAVPNVCNQILREVITLDKMSLAHVIMQPKDASLLHKHATFSEIYFIIDGKGILYAGDRAFRVNEEDYLILPKDTPHKLKNTEARTLEHLVFSVPRFNPEDVILLDESEYKEPEPKHKPFYKKQVEALDGAIIYELLTEKERQKFNMSLAVGWLPPARKAITHLHKKSEELYLVLSGVGNVKVGKLKDKIQRGSLIYIPKGANHALENTRQNAELRVLCVAAPPYQIDDFITSQQVKM